MIETLIATSIILMLIITMIPIISLMNTEKKLRLERLEFMNSLHDALQPYLWMEQPIPHTYQKNIDLKPVTFSFVREGNMIKGCVEWNNVKQTEERVCLYGIPEK